MWSTTCWPHLLPISFPSSNFRPVKQYRAKNTRIRGQRESVLPIVLALLWNNLVWKIILIALQVRPWVLRYPPRKATSLMQLTVPVWCWLMMTLACLKYCRFSVIPIFIPSSCSLDISMSIDSQTLHYSNILDVVNISMIQRLAFRCGEQTCQFIRPFIVPNASTTMHKHKCDARNPRPLSPVIAWTETRLSRLFESCPSRITEGKKWNYGSLV